MTLAQNAYKAPPSYPEYHSKMLLVQVQPLRQSARPVGIAAAARESFAGELSFGMAALANFERAGLIKRIIPIARLSERELAAGEEGMIARAPGASEPRQLSWRRLLQPRQLGPTQD